jgi:hypothetical protein
VAEEDVEAAGTLRQEMAGLRRDFDQQRIEWKAFRTQMEHRFELISLNDANPENIRTYERGVLMTDAQRVLLKASIVNLETRQIISAAQVRTASFWDSWLGRVLAVVSILAAIVVVLGFIYEDFFGLSHSILSH